jgi:putative flippase GtrA
MTSGCGRAGVRQLGNGTLAAVSAFGEPSATPPRVRHGRRLAQRRARGPLVMIRGLHDRFAHLVREAGKFGIVGAICYVIDIAVFNLWLNRTGEPVTAKVISTVIAATVAFAGNRFWTWRHRERSSLTREYSLYFGFNLVGLVISVACLWLSHYGLGSMWPTVFTTKLADNVSANVIGVGAASLFRFWAYRRFVFRPATSEA